MDDAQSAGSPDSMPFKLSLTCGLERRTVSAFTRNSSGRADGDPPTRAGARCSTRYALSPRRRPGSFLEGGRAWPELRCPPTEHGFLAVREALGWAGPHHSRGEVPPGCGGLCRADGSVLASCQ